MSRAIRWWFAFLGAMAINPGLVVLAVVEVVAEVPGLVREAVEAVAEVIVAAARAADLAVIDTATARWPSTDAWDEPSTDSWDD